jgi:thioredoxin-dependent adenylylsulfate APS reductase
MATTANLSVVKKHNKKAVLELIASGEAESWSPQEILSWAVENFSPRLALSCSFGAREGMVLLDMYHRIDPAARVFTLDTGRVPQATHDLVDRIRDRYDTPVEVVFPRSQDVEAMVRAEGMNLFYESVEKRQRCCRIRKVEPLGRYLADLDAWVSGLRRDQNVTRADTPKIEIDDSHGGIVKLNPIADWSEAQVLEYVRAHSIPVNRLHGEGYPSVGCAPCSRAVAPGDDPRSGRWWWENPETRECGIHVDEEDQGSGI